MLRHNFLVIYRSFKRFKSTFFINLAGLSAGLACTLLIFLWVSDELKIDKFHANDAQLFQVLENRIQAHGTITSPTTSAPMARSLAAEMPEVEYAISSKNIETTLSVKDIDIKAKGKYVSEPFFKLFSYELIEGSEDQVLADKNAIVISENLARKLFHTTENLIGKAIELRHEKQYTISGIFKDVPEQSSEQFDFLTSFEVYLDFRGENANWFNTDPQTFVLLKKGTNVAAFNAKIIDFVKTKSNGDNKHRTVFLTPYSECYLYGRYDGGVRAGGRIEYVRLFSIIAIFILGIACINFMNLSTAKASGRLKEVGVKKAIGASRKALIFQYYLESVFMTMLALTAALLIVWIALPQFNEITDKKLNLNLGPDVILSLLAITLFTGLVSGSYPALYLSGFNPVAVLKGKLMTSFGEIVVRKGLVIFQFALSVILIVSVLVVYKQIEFVQSQNLGYNKDNILYFEQDGKLEDAKNAELFVSEMKKIPGIESASTMGHDLTGHNSGTSGVEWAGKDSENRTEFENISVNYDMMETLRMQMVEGRTFEKSFGADSSKIIFNETAIKFMGMKDPIGKTVKLWGEEMQIIGVVKDFHYESLHEKLKPVFIRLSPQSTYTFMAKVKAGKEQEVIAQLTQLHTKLNPGFTMEYRFLDEEYRRQYVSEQRVSVLSRYFAILAILISCLGLFGLAAFTAERRLKEIGIRKVLGSGVFSIVYLLSGDFTKSVAIGIAIALPVSYYMASSWLETFAFSIDLKLWYFALAGIVALLIAWLTVGSQAIKAANVNPLQCLKSE
ncbi:ABC transporter permease [Dyadobacter chenwenxiniae]|uniref:ABC transporter permease n=1 Tax=Dyadobacter chenwenxiniae TaxID=2906456 RepID=A0A9X1TFI4_9BACT|nr:ABC transporter permease [Dyadobacter chenwenxiniae]MCF0062982.1 ABC transporter permease [Dyadobacter chenwenxiniae]UON84844.1 ABC transporter permease [Dyadobacter chenwenxiniae]